MPARADTPARLAVMLSGGGRTLANLADHIRGGALDAEIALVIASRESTGARNARAAGVPTEVIRGEIPAPTLQRLLDDHRIDYTVLAGYLKLVHIPRAYEGRVVNIHPGLLPLHGGKGMYGRAVHEAVLAAGETESGCTVHFADAEYDRGPIILQKRCPVSPRDTPESLAARVFDLECRAYPEALQRLIEERRRTLAGRGQRG